MAKSSSSSSSSSTTTEEEESESNPDEALRHKRRAWLVVGVVLLLVVGGSTILFLIGLPQKFLSSAEPAALSEASRPDEPAFYDLPDLVITLNNAGAGANVLKLRLALELASSRDVPFVDRALRRTTSEFQIYLRELRLEDLKGAGGMDRLRRELRARALTTSAPARINDVLVQELIFQ